jgi:ABC-type multidrug transport system fused ATPase/permease subunit
VLRRFEQCLIVLVCFSYIRLCSSQEPALFATTIRNNILYGNPDATQEQIEEAARLANAHDFIMSLSEKSVHFVRNGFSV